MLQDFARDGEDLLDTILATARRPANLRAGPGPGWPAPSISSGLCTSSITPTLKLLLSMSSQSLFTMPDTRTILQDKQHQAILQWEAPLRQSLFQTMTSHHCSFTKAGLDLSSDRCAGPKGQTGDMVVPACTSQKTA